MTTTSTKSAAAKLAIKDSYSVRIISGGRDGLGEELVGQLPPMASYVDGDASADAVLLFVESEAELTAGLPEAFEAVSGAGVFWVCYPKRKNPKPDVNRDVIWRCLSERDWKAVTNVSLGTEWSAVRGRPV